MDIAAYVLGGIGGLILVFAGLHGYENKSVTIVAFGVGAIFVIIGICCYWQDSVWKNEASKGTVVQRSARDEGALMVVSSVAGEPLQPEIGQTFRVIVKFVNRGHSPAKNVRIVAVVEPVGSGNAPNLTYSGDPTVRAGTIPPGVEHQVTLRPVTSKSTGEERPLTQELYDAIRTGDTRIFVHGRIDYEDASNPHWTTFCYFLITPFDGHFGFWTDATNRTDD
jgi:hypothetical protein